MWRLGLFLKGLAIRVVRGKRTNAPELALLHQAILRLERRVEILETKHEIGSTESKGMI
jgi:hypothetical protein